MQEAVTLIDGWLTEMNGRMLFSDTEVVNFALDIRQILSPTREDKDVGDETSEP